MRKFIYKWSLPVFMGALLSIAIIPYYHFYNWQWWIIFLPLAILGNYLVDLYIKGLVMENKLKIINGADNDKTLE